jgi:hypothetical protein
MTVRVFLSVGLAFLSCTIATQAQDKFQGWHGIPVQPGATTPQCLFRKDTDYREFWPCSAIPPVSYNYLRDHEILIWAPPHYKVGPVGGRFWAAQIGSLLMAVADEETSQQALRSPYCIERGCTEANPLLGKTRLQAYSVIGAIEFMGIMASRKERRYQVVREQVGLPQWRTIFYSWWLPDVVSDAYHVAGIADAVSKIEAR